MELVFSKVAACNFDLLHFLKHQWLSPFLTKLQAAEFNTNSNKIKYLLFQTNNYEILGVVLATEAIVHRCSSKRLKTPTTLLKRLQCKCVPVKFVKFLRITFSQNTSGGCFCCQNKSKETKRYSKKQYSRNIFVET